MKTAIIGGGISGLTTALSMHRLGLDFEVFEKAPEFREIGAGIMLQPNALQVLDGLGVGDEIRQNGRMLDSVVITDQHFVPARGTSLRPSHSDPSNAVVSIHRGRLQSTLLEALPQDRVHAGHRFVSMKAHTDDVEIGFMDKTVRTELLIGADGIHSHIRKQLFGDASLRYSGQTCWRGIADLTLPEQFMHTGVEAWGSKRRFGFSPVDGNKVYWFAVLSAPERGKDNLEILQEELFYIFKEFDPLVQEIIAHTDHIIRNDISDLRRLDRWHQGRVCLIGDAAHATTPNMGQGACQGIEDAWYLSHMLAADTAYPQVFESFERMRRSKVDYVVDTSWRLGQLAHSSIGQKILKIIMKFTPESTLNRQLEKLYTVRKQF